MDRNALTASFAGLEDGAIAKFQNRGQPMAASTAIFIMKDWSSAKQVGQGEQKAFEKGEAAALKNIMKHLRGLSNSPEFSQFLAKMELELQKNLDDVKSTRDHYEQGYHDAMHDHDHHHHGAASDGHGHQHGGSTTIAMQGNGVQMIMHTSGGHGHGMAAQMADHPDPMIANMAQFSKNFNEHSAAFHAAAQHMGDGHHHGVTQMVLFTDMQGSDWQHTHDGELSDGETAAFEAGYNQIEKDIRKFILQELAAGGPTFKGGDDKNWHETLDNILLSLSADGF